MVQSNHFKDEKVNLPEEIPVFPLPNVILFPKVDLPLYIFEPRYKKMLADCRSSHKFIAISLLKKGWEKEQEPMPSYDVVGVGYLRAVFENADGTSYVLIRGVSRAQILRYTQWRPYRTAQIKKLPDRIGNARELMQLNRKLKQLFMQRLRWMSDNPDRLPRIPRDMAGPISLSHLASFIVHISPYQKQSLLETLNPNSRLKHLIHLLEEENNPHGSQN